MAVIYFLILLLVSPWIFGWAMGFFGFVAVLLNIFLGDPYSDNGIILMAYLGTGSVFLMAIIFACKPIRRSPKGK